MLFAVIQNETFDPGDIGVFGADGVVARANGVADLVEQLFGLGHGGGIR